MDRIRGRQGGAGEPPDWPQLADRMDQLRLALERWNLGDYLSQMQRPGRLIWVNFLAGTARGVGIAFGFTIVTAIILRLLSSALVRNLPVIGQFIAEVVQLVQLNLRP